MTVPEHITQSDLRAQIERHLLMVEEVLGGMDQFLMDLESRVTRIEDFLGMHATDVPNASLTADVRHLKADVAKLLRR